MKTIQIEQLPFELIYLYLNDPFAFSKPLNQNLRIFEPFIKEKLKNHFNIRVVLTQGFFGSDVYYVFYLYFKDDKMPINLDQKIKTDTFTDADFENSVLTRLQRTVCRYCDWKGPTLCIEHDCYIRNFELDLKKMRTFEFKPCPNCGESLGQSVVKIF